MQVVSAIAQENGCFGGRFFSLTGKR